MNIPAGWHDDGSGRQRWWDGTQWTNTFAPVAQVNTAGPLTAGSLDVKREVSYVRQQKGHSLILHLTLGALVLWIPAIYYTISPNHYWHA